MHYLYVITNLLNDKKYIGQTSDPEKRWITHKTLSKPKMYVDLAIAKHGARNFLFKIVGSSTSQEEANVLEDELINEHGTRDKNIGYNIKPGGKVASGWKHSEETKIKISATEKGKIVSRETRLKMSNSQKKRTRSRPEYEKMSATKKNKWLAKFTDELIVQIKSEYASGSTMEELSKKYQTRRSTISKIVRGLDLL